MTDLNTTRFRGLAKSAAMMIGMISLAGVAPAAEPLADLTIGAPAPDFAAQGADGKVHHLHDYRGSVVVLEWTSPACEVTAQFYASGKIQAIQRAAVARKVIWLLVNTGAPGTPGYVTPDGAKRYVQKRGAKVSNFLFDPTGSIGRHYGARATPSAYIVNAKGTLVYQGAFASTPEPGSSFVGTALDEVMAGKPVTVPSTPQRGCRVEY